MRQILGFLLMMALAQGALATPFTCPDPKSATAVPIVQNSTFITATLSKYPPPTNLACLYQLNGHSIVCIVRGNFSPNTDHWREQTPGKACGGLGSGLTVADCALTTPEAAPTFDQLNCILSTS